MERKYGLDYDGVISDMNRVRTQWIKQHLDIDINPWETNRTNCIPIIGQGNYDTMVSEVLERDSTLSAPEIPGVFEVLRRMNETGKVYIITMRPERRVKSAEEWLQNKGTMNYISEILSAAELGKDKLDICLENGLYCLIEDDERHLISHLTNKIRRILFKNGAVGLLDLPPYIEYATNMEAISLLLGLY